MKHDPDCLFCRIVAGEIPCHRIYEDAQTLAFLDIGPICDGHVLVIPKTHAVTLDELSPEEGGALGQALVKVAAALRRASGAAGCNVLQNNGAIAGQVVGHVHFHLIPAYDSKHRLPVTWNAGKLENQTATRWIERLQQAFKDPC